MALYNTTVGLCLGPYGVSDERGTPVQEGALALYNGLSAGIPHPESPKPEPLHPDPLKTICIYIGMYVYTCTYTCEYICIYIYMEFRVRSL